MNDYLYSPWRMDYILGKKAEECIFCLPIDGSEDEKHLVVHRDEHCFVILNLYPYNNGHLMVVPVRHVNRLALLNKVERNALFGVVVWAEQALEDIYHPEGINIGLNLGRAAGAGVDAHLHVHLVPRWQGDVNFMSCVGGVRVIPEAFERTYLLFKEYFDKGTGKP